MTRQPGELERTYIGLFQRFASMIAEGSFPFAGPEVNKVLDFTEFFVLSVYDPDHASGAAVEVLKRRQGG